MAKNPQDEDRQSLIEKEGGVNDDDSSDLGVDIRLPQPGEYVENRKFCFCLPFAFFIMFFSIIIQLDFIFQVVNLI